ncbi:hypothetical protein BGW38_000334 [Lunasporangiospora selenospora]|uniref:Uncharacterized protein n=1 Tax=Lunasporangiospora selenospora TaxID=979761 RepID=A0A9P6KIJ5_9FUNG|nr:hypothetical protein BGW38_000334 [Lunasporangiospora selenospora]
MTQPKASRGEGSKIASCGALASTPETVRSQRRRRSSSAVLDSDQSTKRPRIGGGPSQSTKGQEQDAGSIQDEIIEATGSGDDIALSRESPTAFSTSMASLVQEVEAENSPHHSGFGNRSIHELNSGDEDSANDSEDDGHDRTSRGDNGQQHDESEEDLSERENDDSHAEEDDTDEESGNEDDLERENNAEDGRDDPSHKNDSSSKKKAPGMPRGKRQPYGKRALWPDHFKSRQPALQSNGSYTVSAKVTGRPLPKVKSKLRLKRQLGGPLWEHSRPLLEAMFRQRIGRTGNETAGKDDQSRGKGGDNEGTSSIAEASGNSERLQESQTGSQQDNRLDTRGSLHSHATLIGPRRWLLDAPAIQYPYLQEAFPYATYKAPERPACFAPKGISNLPLTQEWYRPQGSVAPEDFFSMTKFEYSRRLLKSVKVSADRLRMDVYYSRGFELAARRTLDRVRAENRKKTLEERAESWHGVNANRYGSDDSDEEPLTEGPSGSIHLETSDGREKAPLPESHSDPPSNTSENPPAPQSRDDTQTDPESRTAASVNNEPTVESPQSQSSDEPTLTDYYQVNAFLAKMFMPGSERFKPQKLSPASCRVLHSLLSGLETKVLAMGCHKQRQLLTRLLSRVDEETTKENLSQKPRRKIGSYKLGLEQPEIPDTSGTGEANQPPQSQQSKPRKAKDRDGNPYFGLRKIDMDDYVLDRAPRIRKPRGFATMNESPQNQIDSTLQSSLPLEPLTTREQMSRPVEGSEALLSKSREEFSSWPSEGSTSTEPSLVMNSSLAEQSCAPTPAAGPSTSFTPSPGQLTSSSSPQTSALSGLIESIGTRRSSVLEAETWPSVANPLCIGPETDPFYIAREYLVVRSQQQPNTAPINGASNTPTSHHP